MVLSFVRVIFSLVVIAFLDSKEQNEYSDKYILPWSLANGGCDKWISHMCDVHDVNIHNVWRSAINLSGTIANLPYVLWKISQWLQSIANFRDIQVHRGVKYYHGQQWMMTCPHHNLRFFRNRIPSLHWTIRGAKEKKPYKELMFSLSYIQYM